MQINKSVAGSQALLSWINLFSVKESKEKKKKVLALPHLMLE